MWLLLVIRQYKISLMLAISKDSAVFTKLAILADATEILYMMS